MRDEVTKELRRRILSGELAQGERLVEDRLAATLGVSRNPVRESIRVLAAEGFIQVVPRLGATVARLSAEEGEELFDVRMAIEGLAARLAARKRSPPRPTGCAGCWTRRGRRSRRGGWRRWPISTRPSTWPWARRRGTRTWR
ncbi:GntR family transcriptional regulator [Nonomuraea thailandensis]